MAQMTGSFLPQQVAFGVYLQRWFKQLDADTKGVAEFKARPLTQAIMWAPSRMIDQAEAMLAQYRKNENGAPGASTKLPIVLLASDDDFLGTGADWGGLHTDFARVQILEGGSWYDYRQYMHDRRVQMAVFANDPDTAKSIAMQLSHFMQQPQNRYFDSHYTFGQYQVPAAIQLETKRIDWMRITNDSKNLKILAGDIALKCVIPVLRAPGDDEPNDGSTNNPPGYPVVQKVHGMQSAGTDQAHLVKLDERISE